MNMTVTVVIPAYNVAQTLADCLRALRTQNTPGQFDIIVVDDGSTDNTSGVAESFGALTVRQPHRGSGIARNTGMRAAKREWVAFTDAEEPGRAPQVVIGREDATIIPPGISKAVPGATLSAKTGEYS